jgi:TonB family protein
MISRMAPRSISLLLILFAIVIAPSRAQKCKGMEVKYENEIQYPNSARAARIQGDVTIQVHIATDGTVTADIVSGPPVLAESAKRFVESWTVSWPGDAPPTACAPVLKVTYKLRSDKFNVKAKLPTHILVEAPPIETNEPAPH